MVEKMPPGWGFFGFFFLMEILKIFFFKMVFFIIKKVDKEKTENVCLWKK